MALSAYLDGKKVLFYTREITAKQCFRRIDSITTNCPYRWVRYGFPNDEEFNSFMTKLRESASVKRLGSLNIFDVSGTHNKNELDYLHSKIALEKPDIVFVDGVYLIQGGKGVAEWERIKNTTNRLKQLAITMNIPVIGTTQATRGSKHGSIEMEDVGGSISFAQDCDYMFSINRIIDPVTERLSNEVVFRCVASRDGGDFESKIVLDFETMKFNEYGVDSNEQIDFERTVDTECHSRRTR
jgi:replicative DNA helicase